jgi:AcrR family transcriptional regulator
MSEDSETKRQPLKSYHHGDLRNALIQAGLALLAEEGVSGLDLRKVARRAGVSHNAPYRHFADKQALWAAIAELGFHQLTVQIQAALANSAEDPGAQLTAIARSYIVFACENPALMREMFSGLTIDRFAYPTLYSASKAPFTITVDVIQRGQTGEVIVVGDPVYLTVVAWSLMHGLAMLLIENQIPEARENDDVVEELLQRCMQQLYDGLMQK